MGKSLGAASAATVGALAMLMAVPPARADWDHGGGHEQDWRRHEHEREHFSREQSDWREHTWRRWDNPYNAPPPVFYAQPPRYYAQPPTYYVPAPNYYGD